MATISAEFQAALYAHLTTELSPTVVYDGVPSGAGAEYVTIGDDIVSAMDDKVRFDKYVLTVSVHTWSRGQQSRGPLKTLMDKVLTALNRQTFPIIGYSVLLCRAVNQRTIRDPDGVTFHGIQVFEVTIDVTT